MSGFDDFAKKLNEQHQERTQQFLEKQATERQQRDDRYRSEIVKIEAEAMPIIEDAKAALSRQGIILAIKKNWEPDLFTSPAVDVQVFGQKARPHDGSTYQLDGDKVIVSIADGRLKSQVSRRLYTARQKREEYVKYDPDGLDSSLRDIIAALFEALSPDNG